MNKENTIHWPPPPGYYVGIEGIIVEAERIPGIYAFNLDNRQQHQNDQKVYEHVFVISEVEKALNQISDSFVIGDYGFLASKEEFSLRGSLRDLSIFLVCKELKGETTFAPEYEVPEDKSDPIGLTWDEFRQLAEAEKMTDDNCLKTIKSSNLYYLYDGTKPCVFLWLDHIKEMAEKLGVSFDHIFIFDSTIKSRAIRP